MRSATPLRVLLVLSIIYGSITFFSCISMAIAMPMLDNFYNANQGLLPAEFFTAWQRMVMVPRTLYAAQGLLGLLSVVGCVLMWNLRRSGYHCYAIAQLLLILLPVLFIGKGFTGIGDLMFTALFLYIYYRMLKNLDVFSSEETQPTDEE